MLSANDIFLIGDRGLDGDGIRKTPEPGFEGFEGSFSALFLNFPVEGCRSKMDNSEFEKWKIEIRADGPSRASDRGGYPLAAA